MIGAESCVAQDKRTRSKAKAGRGDGGCDAGCPWRCIYVICQSLSLLVPQKGTFGTKDRDYDASPKNRRRGRREMPQAHTYLYNVIRMCLHTYQYIRCARPYRLTTCSRCTSKSSAFLSLEHVRPSTLPKQWEVGASRGVQRENSANETRPDVFNLFPPAVFFSIIHPSFPLNFDRQAAWAGHVAATVETEGGTLMYPDGCSALLPLACSRPG